MDWNISRSQGYCLSCRKSFQEAEEFFSSLWIEQDGLLRRDYCLSCWSEGGVAGFFSFWKTRIPKKEEPIRRPVDGSVIFNLFLRLGEVQEPWARNLEYVLGLFLLRKKRLRLKGQGRDEKGEFLLLASQEEDRLFHLYDPNLSEVEIERLNDEIVRLLDPSGPQGSLLSLQSG